MSPPPLSRAVIVYETEAACSARLRAHGMAEPTADEVAVYLAQATDLPAFFPEITAALQAEGIAVTFLELDALTDALPGLRDRAAETILWNVTDGVRYCRGSAVPALARLAGIARFGAPPQAQHICQDKFASLAIAVAAGVVHPPTILLEGAREVARLGEWPVDAGKIFVKPNTLGAKIGIFADSLCNTLEQARDRAARIHDRYGDRALAQPFVAGDDVRVSFLDQGGTLASQLGIARLARDPGSETGGLFMTMRDNETLSGARDTAGGRGAFGAARAAAFVPRMEDLRADPAPASRATVAEITGAVGRLSDVLGLTDCFSADFRVDAKGRATFLEFEVCPAVTIYDFQDYLRTTHGRGLGAALAVALRLAHRRHLEAPDR